MAVTVRCPMKESNAMSQYRKKPVFSMSMSCRRDFGLSGRRLYLAYANKMAAESKKRRKTRR